MLPHNNMGVRHSPVAGSTVAAVASSHHLLKSRLIPELVQRLFVEGLNASLQLLQHILLPALLKRSTCIFLVTVGPPIKTWDTTSPPFPPLQLPATTPALHADQDPDAWPPAPPPIVNISYVSAVQSWYGAVNTFRASTAFLAHPFYNTEPLRTEGRLNGHTVTILLDSGSQANLMNVPLAYPLDLIRHLNNTLIQWVDSTL
ncbi:hypothetical protein BDK51DRAFT_28848 [Blyttiomyces helicus]|uniref:Uncharacterized protein n=1 Tax=Blyttiomyces helicus TaxID=388810 RepID=A0A4P9WQ52_9FUNG|nr:hypothetical protein BDK51DRAFT_28848 [Blyttiomyces helicus]|eukprot:RKO93918.1 hypothetical protein BDK51DRAFT_28848 [Blyttiomyces helicus]